MITCYHSHSNLSDGDNSIDEIVSSAITAGIEEIGISDHYVFLPSGETLFWSMLLDGIADYFNLLNAAKDKYSNKISMKFGIEADYIPDTASKVKTTLTNYPFDYIIGSVHIVDGILIDSTAETWFEMSQSKVNDVIIRYWELILELSGFGFCDFIGHIDLYKKFGFLPDIDISDKIYTTLECIKDNNLAIELNTSGWFKPVAEQYPSVNILQECIKRDIPIIITSDIHELPNLTRAFTRAKELLISLGCKNTAVFSQRIRKTIQL